MYSVMSCVEDKGQFCMRLPVEVLESWNKLVAPALEFYTAKTKNGLSLRMALERNDSTVSLILDNCAQNENKPLPFLELLEGQWRCEVVSVKPDLSIPSEHGPGSHPDSDVKIELSVKELTNSPSEQALPHITAAVSTAENESGALFQCDLCPFQVVRLSGLMRHRARSHPIAGESVCVEKEQENGSLKKKPVVEIPVKRKRGRPRKQKLEAKQLSDDGIQEMQTLYEDKSASHGAEKEQENGSLKKKPVAETPVKRKRGRPRKQRLEAKELSGDGIQELQTLYEDKSASHNIQTDVCILCGAVFPSCEELTMHVRYEHCETNSVADDYSDSDGQLERGEDVELDPHVTTPNTTVNKTNTSARKKSSRKHSPNSPKLSYNCELCKKAFLRMTRLIHHIKKDHSAHSDVQKFLSRAEIKKQEDYCDQRKSYPVKCSKCNITFYGRTVLTHFKNYHLDIPNYEKEFADMKSVMIDELNKHRREMDKAKKFSQQCHHCGNMFQSRCTYYKHINYRCKLNPNCKPLFRCNICGNWYPKQKSLDEHKAERHPSDKNEYNCSLCEKSFKARSTFEIHMRMVHEIAKKKPLIPFKCEICGKSFKRLRDCQRHQAKHSDTRPHVCLTCDKAFKTREHLSRHKRHIHENRYQFHCELCGHGMEKIQYLKTHKCGRVRPRNEVLPIVEQPLVDLAAHGFALDC